MAKFVWVTNRTTCLAYRLKWENGETDGWFYYNDPNPISPYARWEDIFIYKKEIYVADFYRGLYVFNMEGQYQRHWHPTRPWGVWVKDDEVYVSRQPVSKECAIRVYDLVGNLQREWEISGTYGTVQTAYGVSVGPNNLVYAALDFFYPHYNQSKLKSYTKSGVQVKEIVFPNGSGRPLAWRSTHYKNELYVTDFPQCLVKIFDLDLNFKRQFGPGYHVGSSSPKGIGISSNKVVVKASYPETPLSRYTLEGIIDPTFVSDVENAGGIFVPTGKVQHLPTMGMG